MDTGVTPRVYIANYAGHDYSPVKKYGELYYVIRGFISFQSLDRLKFQVAEGICDSRAEDYLVLSGTNIINVFAALLWFSLHGKCKILNFDKTKNDYRLVTLTRENITDLLKVLKNDNGNEAKDES